MSEGAAPQESLAIGFQIASAMYLIYYHAKQNHAVQLSIVALTVGLKKAGNEYNFLNNSLTGITVQDVHVLVENAI